MKLVTDCTRAHWQKSANDSGVTGQGAEPLHEISKRNRGINTSAAEKHLRGLVKNKEGGKKEGNNRV